MSSEWKVVALSNHCTAKNQLKAMEPSTELSRKACGNGEIYGGRQEYMLWSSILHLGEL